MPATKENEKNEEGRMLASEKSLPKQMKVSHATAESTKSSLTLDVRGINQTNRKSRKLESLKNVQQPNERRDNVYQNSKEKITREEAPTRHATYRAHKVLEDAKKMQKGIREIKKSGGTGVREQISLRQLIQELRQATNKISREIDKTKQMTKEMSKGSAKKAAPSMGGGGMGKVRKSQP